MQRRLLTWVAGAAGAAFVVARKLRRRSSPAPDPATELRRRLDESRSARPPSEPEPATPTGLDERRRSVHEQGRAALEEMRERGEPPPSDPGG